MGEAKIIFLDVDGVLNTTKDHETMSRDNFFVRESKVERLCRIIMATDARVVFSTTWRFYPEMIGYVDEKIKACLSEMKYSNQGRVSPRNGRIPTSLYDDVVISSTPDLSEPKYTVTPLRENFHQTRSDEIILWLKENAVVPLDLTVKKGCPEHSRKYAKKGDVKAAQWLLPKKIRVKNFIAIDDMVLSLFSCYKRKADLGNHFVMTKTQVGLEGKHEKLAIKMLNADFNFEQWYENVHVACDRPQCFYKGSNIKKLDPNASKLVRHNRFSINVKPMRSKTEPTHDLQENKTIPKKTSTPARSPPDKEDDGYDFVL